MWPLVLDLEVYRRSWTIVNLTSCILGYLSFSFSLVLFWEWRWTKPLNDWGILDFGPSLNLTAKDTPLFLLLVETTIMPGNFARVSEARLNLTPLQPLIFHIGSLFLVDVTGLCLSLRAFQTTNPREDNVGSIRIRVPLYHLYIHRRSLKWPTNHQHHHLVASTTLSLRLSKPFSATIFEIFLVLDRNLSRISCCLWTSESSTLQQREEKRAMR